MSDAPTENVEVEIPIRTTMYEGKELRYKTPNSLTQWRVDTLFLEEPDTVRWISCMKEGEVLIDIGANVGMYSTLAAVGRNLRVYAFEPESQNHSLLNQNIYLNQVSEKVSGYCVALSDTSGLSQLYLGHMDAGGAFHSSGEALDFNLEPLNTPFVQGCVLMTLDQLVEEGTIPLPDHIKLDVDGFEYKVVNGMMNTIHNQKVKSVAIELNPNLVEHQKVFQQMAELGFEYFENQRAESCLEDGPFKDIGNVIFYRAPWFEYETLYKTQIGPMRVQKSVAKMLKNLEQATNITKATKATNVSKVSREQGDEAATNIVINNIFPAEFYQNLLTNIPSDNAFVCAETTNTAKTFELNATFINCLPGAAIPFWSQLSYELNSNETLRSIVDACLGQNAQTQQQIFKSTAVIVRAASPTLTHQPGALITLWFDLNGANHLTVCTGACALAAIDKNAEADMLKLVIS
ncbi:MAG: FkbM family methyltransferase [Pseudomonadales bacterium]|nr:FkbM family methyltransferase [Pseudomonadales bacterium]